MESAPYGLDPSADSEVCVADEAALEPIRTCVNAANRANQDAALERIKEVEGLTPLERPLLDGPSSPPDGAHVVYGGTYGGCPETAESRWGGTELARDRDGNIVLLQLKPELEPLTYPTCGCADPCGGAEEDQLVIEYILEPGERLDRVIDVPFSGIWFADVGIQDCPEPA